MDLSNEVLNIDFGQVAAKISKVKLISANSALGSAEWQIFFSTFNFDL